MRIALLCFFIGFTAGLRSLTPPAVLCWSTFLGRLHFGWGKFALIGSPLAVAFTTLLACGELIADKLPRTPARTKPIGLAARVFTGSVCAIALSNTAGANWYWGTIIGSIGAIAGAFAGYHARRVLVVRVGRPDLIVAIAEDVIAIGASVMIYSLAI